MKTLYTVGCIAALMFLGSCEEMGFTLNTEQGDGEFNKNSILLDVRDDSETIYNSPSRAGNELDDFKILFFKDNGTAPEKSYRYADMPDIVTLPVGRYTVTATKGVDVEADWESPYYVGESDAFYIMRDEVTTEVNPIVCRLQNVKVTVEFDPMLSVNMSPDSYVEVKVGDNAGLRYTKDKEGVAGHFKHTEGVSMVASFNGTVEGVPTVENKSFEVVKKGHHYKIRFKLHSQGDGHSGQADAEVNVDASVTTVDLEYNVEIGADQPLDDSERPTEGGGETPDVPNPPAQNDAPPTIEALPQSNAAIPNIEFGKENVIVDEMECVLMIRSSAESGFTKFECKIDSETLDIEQVGLSNPLDLINPGANEDALISLQLLSEGQKVEGSKEVKFDLTNFLPLITVLGSGTHNFILSIGDDNGETTKTLILKSN
ncbi:MAG: DUF4493 domain-containing protein [Muribaculaceae bacterium]|nr:DUF4493 domain-containing protein [Muribaculaceae bacterium]